MSEFKQDAEIRILKGKLDDFVDQEVKELLEDAYEEGKADGVKDGYQDGYEVQLLQNHDCDVEGLLFFEQDLAYDDYIQ